jgi:hypothetical protein
MLSNSYFADGGGICSADLHLLDRLRLMQERLDRLLEPAAESPRPPDSAGTAISSDIGSAIGSGIDSGLQRTSRTSIWRVTAGRIGR